MFECRDLHYRVGNKALLKDINVSFEVNTITAIIGANGAGKSTLFNALLGELPVESEHILFCHKPLSHYSLNELAKQRAFVAQHHRLAFSLPVFEYLLLAREHLCESESDAFAALQQACSDFQILHLLEQDMARLSGGEAQLIEFTRAYLQLYPSNAGSLSAPLQDKCLLLDEPASALDIKQTKRLYQFLLAFKAQGGTVVLIDHDINAMASIADNMVLLKEGSVLAAGSTEQVFVEPMLNTCFDVHGNLYQPHANLIEPSTASTKQNKRRTLLQKKPHSQSIFHVDICY
ncbi:ABC transporter ATP-binding protein [Glaciecola sp. XM2]|uniref:ATP-binding cassette domain-containing protein n=1 Tax=Glaciecola sp. XM2 TaxID=1914931 RepID=UPI001BDDDD49|nr:ABC transporter ATP-binding protein [Glaciecola sp. XM2]MBT1450595.1 ABC transporter ATP-binding protein [Glaciecola sp. XM2]